jgi:hypothetical protein
LLCRKIGKNSIDNICPPVGQQALKKILNFSLSDREKVGGEKGGGRRLWECGKPVGFSIISMAGARGERGR